MYQHILALCMFSVFGNRHRWLIQDNVRLADSFVLLSADWPSDFTAEHAECQNMLIHPHTTTGFWLSFVKMEFEKVRGLYHFWRSLHAHIRMNQWLHKVFNTIYFSTKRAKLA